MILIIPAKNEEKRIIPTVEDYLSFFPLMRILVVISPSSDNTEPVVVDLKKKYPNNLSYYVLKNATGNTKGLAVRQGFEQALSDPSLAKEEIIGFTDADNSLMPEQYKKLLQQLPPQGAAIASRYLPASDLKDRDSWLRVTASWVFRFLVRQMFNLPWQDTQCGGKVFSRNALVKICDKLQVNDMAFDVEILYYLRKNKISTKEVPVVWREKITSTISNSSAVFIKTSWQMAWSLIKLRLRTIKET